MMILIPTSLDLVSLIALEFGLIVAEVGLARQVTVADAVVAPVIGLLERDLVGGDCLILYWVIRQFAVR